MKVVIIGGSGHIGSYLTPRLVEAGHEVICVRRGSRAPYMEHAAWEQVTTIHADREAEDAAGTFAPKIAALQPDAVIDLVCFTPESNRLLTTELAGVSNLKAFLHCGTIWIHGPSREVPTSEDAPRTPLGSYGTLKTEIERNLRAAVAERGFPAVMIHPGHIVGPGWVPLNPQGNFNPAVYHDLAAGREVLLPHFGLETMHHVHAADVAQLFHLALEKSHAAIGQSFHAVAPQAVTARGYAEAVASWSGREANLRLVPWSEFEAGVGTALAEESREHLGRSPNCSWEKGRQLLGYQPCYSTLEAVRESVAHLPA